MAETRRPRNIRDIAHLYLSRSPSVTRSTTLNLFLSAETKDCLSGFHAANLAAAIALRQARVRVFELSGLLPNAAYYFSHQPGVYLGSADAPRREFSPALNTISITFDPIRLMGESSVSDHLRVNLVHLPTIDDGEEFAATLAALKDRCPGERWVLRLTREPGQSRDGLFSEWLDVSGSFTLLLPESDKVTGAVDTMSLGSIRRWEAAVEDRVPIVVRNPRSGLAREYVSLCESILGQINSSRRRNGRERSNGSSPRRISHR